MPTNTPTAETIGIAKELVNSKKISAGTYQVTYRLIIQNFSTQPVSNLQVTDDLTTTYPTPTSFSVTSITSSDFTVDTSYNGNSNSNLLVGTDGLNVDQIGIIEIIVEVIPASTGPFENQAIVSATHPEDGPISDQSQNGDTPDKDGNGDPTNDNEPTPTEFGPTIFDPPFGIKIMNDSSLPILRWTMIWINDSNILALDAMAYDGIPVGTIFMDNGISSGYPVIPSSAPIGSTSTGVFCTTSSTETTTTYCYYEGPTVAYPRGRVIWQGTLGPDLGATNAETAENEINITFDVSLNNGIHAVDNIAEIDADLNGDGDVEDTGEQQVANATAEWEEPDFTSDELELPKTGFAPDKDTLLMNTKNSLDSSTLMMLKINTLGINAPVVGVPFEHNGWDTSWLSQQAGWLEGTTFPTQMGNTVLSGHVYDANGNPGIFQQLDTLVWNDEIIITTNGIEYVYRVREVRITDPKDLSVLQDEGKNKLTLLTCKNYNELRDDYENRLVVQAELIEIR